MLAQQKDIDAVIIATPDHMHAPIASAAMAAGKHVYVQKPMCWSVAEARHLAKQAAANPKLVTQMGNQGHSTDDARRGQDYLASGVIGEIKEVHVWTNRPLAYWPQGVPRPEKFDGDWKTLGWNNNGVNRRLANAFTNKVKCGRAEGLRWDLFLGAAPDVDVPPALPSVQLARLGRLGPGRARRHGRAPHRSSGVGPEARAADVDRDAVDAVQRR